MTKQKAAKQTKTRSSAHTRATNHKNGQRLEFDQVDILARKWLALWASPETRPQMDAVIAHLSREDQSRVTRHAQRLSKAIAITIKEENKHGKKNKER